MSKDYRKIVNDWIQDPLNSPQGLNGDSKLPLARHLIAALSERIYEPYTMQQKIRTDLLVRSASHNHLDYPDSLEAKTATELESAIYFHQLLNLAVIHFNVQQHTEMQRKLSSPKLRNQRHYYRIKRPLAASHQLHLPQTMSQEEIQQATEYLTQHQYAFRLIAESGAGSTLKSAKFHEEDIDFLSFADLPFYGEFNSPFYALKGLNNSPKAPNLGNYVSSIPPSIATKHPMLQTSQEQIRLFNAYIKSYIAEAANRQQSQTGYYNLCIEDLPILESYLIQKIRLIVRPNGIWLAFLFNNSPNANERADYCFFWWSPKFSNVHSLDTNFMDVLFMRLLAASLWRDLCITGRTALHITRSVLNKNLPQKNPISNKALVLPPIVHDAHLGNPQNRENIQKAIESNQQLKQIHRINKRLYRELPHGQKCSDRAIQNALDLGYPPPADGFTFQIPYKVETNNYMSRESIEIQTKGLQTLQFIASGLLNDSKDR